MRRLPRRCGRRFAPNGLGTKSTRLSLFPRPDRCIRSVDSAGKHAIIRRMRVSPTIEIARKALLFCLAGLCLIPSAGAKTFQLPTHNSRTRSWSVGIWNGNKVADLASAGPGRRDGAEYAREISVYLAGSEKSQFTVRSPGAAIQLSLR